MTRFHELRDEQLALATKEFNARGASVSRCAKCLLAERVCICAYTPSLEAGVDIVLLFHREELFKPTNTGRLLLDCLPKNTFGFCWSRTSPDPELLAILNDPERLCLVVFPFDEDLPQYAGRRCLKQLPVIEKKITFILLDGTWKQAGRMFHLSHWLDKDAIALPQDMIREYAVRKSHQESYVSTFEAGVACLNMAGEDANSLVDYFAVFNAHYVALRRCVDVDETAFHARLRQDDR